MLKAIIHHSLNLVSFLNELRLALYKPQMRHLTRLVDALITCETGKTLSELYRQFVEQLDPKTAADFLRESPWEAEDLSGSRRQWMLMKLLALALQAGLASGIKVSVDDSLGKKDKATRHQEAVDFQHNHTESSRKRQVYSNGFVYVEVHIHLGPLGFTFDTRLYLREKTVRRLNRQRVQAGHRRLRYRSKYALAREMLVVLRQVLPPGYPVYVLFDSWYASANWAISAYRASRRRRNGSPWSCWR